MKMKRFHRFLAGLLCVMICLGCLPVALAAGDTPAVTITSVTETGGNVVVSGTVENLGERKVEIIVNEDYNLRFVADTDESGNFTCNFALPYNGEYTVEASVRDYSNFYTNRQTVPDENYFEMNGACTWGSSIVKHSDGLYYMLFSTWDEAKGFSNWYSFSEIAYATSTKLGGPYIYQGPALDVEGSNITNAEMPKWGGGTLSFFHNPNLMHSEKDGKYYLYFISRSTGSGQKVGVAYADTPAGPWTIKEDPVITTREGYHDNSYVCNPSVIELKDEEGNFSYYAVYRSNGTEDGVTIRAAAYATADSPLGPFTQSEERIMYDPTSDYSVEDCHVWFENGQYYALAKDMTGGKITGYTDGSSTALYESTDGVNWTLSENKLAYPTIIPWESGDQTVGLMDRAYVYRVKGVPFMLTNATSDSNISPHSGGHTRNVQIPLLGTVMAADTHTLTVTDGEVKTVDKSELNALLPYATDAIRDYYTEKDWYRLYTAARAGKVLAQRADAEQADVDFAVAEIKEVIDNRTDPAAVSVNIALNKTVTAGSTYSGTAYVASMAVDGDYSTRWSAANGVTGTVTYEIDLGARYQLDSFVIDPLDNRVTGYNVQYYNGTEWKECFATTTGENSGEFTVAEPAEKILFNFTDYQKPPTFWEIEVYGSYHSENIALGKSITASHNYTTNNNYPASNLVDGKADADTTRWSTNNADTGEITIEMDLGGKYFIDSFQIDEFQDRIKSFTWKYWDGTAWQTAYSGTNADGTTGEKNHFHLYGALSGVATEKVQLVIHSSTKGPSIWELEVYGTKVFGDLAGGKRVKASSVYNSEGVGYYPAENAVDGILTTRWAAQNAVGTVTFEIELGDNFFIEDFTITEFADRITGYSWQYSDGSRWITCYEGTNEDIVAGGTNIYYLSDDFTDQVVTDRLRLNILTYTADPSIWELEINGSTIRAEGITLSEDSLSLLAGEETELSVTFTPANTTNKKVIWTSSDESVATVTDGVITAVGQGTAIITATTKLTGHTDTCTLTVTPAAASVGEKFFTTLDAALAAVEDGDTVTLCADVTAERLMIAGGVTLDLNGKTLTTDYLVGFNGAALMDSAEDGSGKLVIAKENLALPKNNPYLPVYDEEGGRYLFTRVKNDRFELTDEGGKPKYSTSPMLKEYVHSLMNSEAKAEKSGVDVIIRLTWSDSEGQYQGIQDYIYYDDSIAQVIASYVNEGGAVNYEKQFYGIFVGSEIESGVDVSVSTVVKSSTGVEMESDKTALFTGE